VVVGVLPTSAGAGVCRWLARLALRIRPRDRERALDNLATALPELSTAERADLLRRATDAFARNFHEALVLQATADLDRTRVTDNGTLAEIAQLRQPGRGLLILTGHIGCWELLGAYLARGLGGLGVVTGTVHNQPVDALIQSRRRRLGMTVLPRDGGARPLVRLLRAGGVVAVLLDQRTRVANLPVPFFGRSAPTAAGFARLALRYRIPVLPVCIGRTDGGHEVRHLPPVALPAGEDPQAQLSLLTACNRALATMIERNPAEWVWFHQRWANDN